LRIYEERSGLKSGRGFLHGLRVFLKQHGRCQQSLYLVSDRKPAFSKKNRDPLKFGEEFYRKKYDMNDIHKINPISFEN